MRQKNPFGNFFCTNALGGFNRKAKKLCITKKKKEEEEKELN
jgi:hypothetical protein